MFKSLLGGIAQIIAKPQVLIAGIIAAVLQLAVLMLTIEPLTSLFEKTVILGEIPAVGLLELPFQFYSMHSAELNIIIAALIASMIIQLWLALAISRFANNVFEKKRGIAEALKFATGKFWTIIAIIVFLFAISAVVFAVFQALAGISEFSTELGILLSIIAALLAIYIYARLVFFIPIMGCKGENLRNSLAGAWEFSNKKFWKIVILMIIIAVAVTIIDFIGALLSDFSQGDIVPAAIISVFSIISTTFSTLVLANYYLNHESEQPKMFYEGRHKRRKH